MLPLAWLGAAACAGQLGSASAREADPPPGVGGSQRGRATYYSDSLAGNKTANGEKYDPKLYTAAHRSLAFGTIVEVVRRDGRRVRVRINDRGPFAGKNRIIDLSRAAAEDIGLVRDGVADVTLEVLEVPPKKEKRR